MAKMNISTKRIQVDKANLTIVIIASAAAFVTIFSLVACKALLSQRSYQSRVIAKKEIAKKQLKANLSARDALVKSYQDFVSKDPNVIGGSATIPDPTAGTFQPDADRSGDNAKIILDALPSAYDFPALATSLEKILVGQGVTIQTIAGTDDEIAQQDAAASGAPAAVEMPFSVSYTSDYTATGKVLDIFQKSIRPFHVDGVTISGNDASLTTTIRAKTYYQPEKTLDIKTEVVK